jgi:hypothetical protein
MVILLIHSTYSSNILMDTMFRNSLIVSFHNLVKSQSLNFSIFKFNMLWSITAVNRLFYEFISFDICRNDVFHILRYGNFHEKTENNLEPGF